MKRATLFFLAVTTASSCLFAQTAKNPFSQLGYKKQITYTSSKGEFEEFHDKTDVVEIGSVYFNTKTNKVVGYVNEEKENAEVATATSAMSVDPLCEKYYWISPYAFCLNNPVRYVDPDGRDVWEVNDKGEIVNRIKDKTQDAFYMVAKDAEGNYQRTYTTDSEGNKTFNSISFKYGTIESQKTIKLNSTESFDVYKVRGDENGTRLFEFMGEHVSGSGSLVEVSQIKTGIEGDKGLNFISTSHQERKESGQKQLFIGQLYTYTIREMNHTHPTNPNPSGLDGDEGFANSVSTYLTKYGLNVPTFNIYHVPTKKYIPFGK